MLFFPNVLRRGTFIIANLKLQLDGVVWYDCWWWSPIYHCQVRTQIQLIDQSTRNDSQPVTFQLAVLPDVNAVTVWGTFARGDLTDERDSFKSVSLSDEISILDLAAVLEQAKSRRNSRLRTLFRRTWLKRFSKSESDVEEGLRQWHPFCNCSGPGLQQFNTRDAIMEVITVAAHAFYGGHTCHLFRCSVPVPFLHYNLPFTRA